MQKRHSAVRKPSPWGEGAPKRRMRSTVDRAIFFEAGSLSAFPAKVHSIRRTMPVGESLSGIRRPRLWKAPSRQAQTVLSTGPFFAVSFQQTFLSFKRSEKSFPFCGKSTDLPVGSSIEMTGCRTGTFHTYFDDFAMPRSQSGSKSPMIRYSGFGAESSE